MEDKFPNVFLWSWYSSHPPPESRRQRQRHILRILASMVESGDEGGSSGGTLSVRRHQVQAKVPCHVAGERTPEHPAGVQAFAGVLLGRQDVLAEILLMMEVQKLNRTYSQSKDF